MSDGAKAIILMGVSGCGKSSVGKQLKEALNWPFYDGDDYHTQANIEKMAQGIPLDDDDRRPWLERLHQLIVEHLDEGSSLIVASSALKKSYRDILRGNNSDVVFVYLIGSFDLIYMRLQTRGGHYMKADMLRSQFAALEEPESALVVSVESTVDEIVDEIISGVIA